MRLLDTSHRHIETCRRMFGRTSFASGLSLFLITADAGPAAVVVANFSAGDLSAWETQHFSGETQYAIEEVGGKAVVRAFSRDSASALFREIEVDLTETPVLRWRWKIDGTLEDNEERVKSGDDFPARVYVIRRHRLLFWKTEAINYVWSSGEPQGTAWPNAYTSNSRIVAVRSGNREAGQWRDEQRNVRQDFTQLFGKDVSTVHGVAIMTDTDNTGQSATAWYGDIRFTAD